MIEFRQLRQFVAVAEELSFGRAAERLHMSQPPLSVAIRNLEDDVGTQLIDRSRHHVRLTPAGRVFFKDAQSLLAQAKAAMERAQRASQGAEGSLSLSFLPSAAIDLLPDVLKRFQRDYPTVRLRVTAGTTKRQLEGLRSAEVDLALVGGRLEGERDLAVVDLPEQALVIAVPLSHALSAQKSVQVKALAGERFIAFSAAEGAGFAATLHEVCKKAGFAPRIVQEASQMQAILTLVAGGLGIAMVPASMRKLAMKDVAFLDLADARQAPTYQLAFAYERSNDNPVIHSFLSAASKVVAAARG